MLPSFAMTRPPERYHPDHLASHRIDRSGVKPVDCGHPAHFTNQPVMSSLARVVPGEELYRRHEIEPMDGYVAQPFVLVPFEVHLRRSPRLDGLSRSGGDQAIAQLPSGE